MPKPLSNVADRLWSGVERGRPDECWPWLRSTVFGYGQIGVKIGGKWTIRRAHRIAYELLVGPVPDGMDLDHTCHTADLDCPGGTACPHRACCNPAHLEPVTRSENLRRMPPIPRGAGAAAQRAKTHCPAGHPYDKENTYVSPTGSRSCRICQRASWRRSAARRKVGAA